MIPLIFIILFFLIKSFPLFVYNCLPLVLCRKLLGCLPPSMYTSTIQLFSWSVRLKTLVRRWDVWLKEAEEHVHQVKSTLKRRSFSSSLDGSWRSIRVSGGGGLIIRHQFSPKWKVHIICLFVLFINRFCLRGSKCLRSRGGRFHQVYFIEDELSEWILGTKSLSLWPWGQSVLVLIFSSVFGQNNGNMSFLRCFVFYFTYWGWHYFWDESGKFKCYKETWCLSLLFLCCFL